MISRALFSPPTWQLQSRIAHHADLSADENVRHGPFSAHQGVQGGRCSSRRLFCQSSPTRDILPNQVNALLRHSQSKSELPKGGAGPGLLAVRADLPEQGTFRQAISK
ncbi:hypothetical protein E2320_021278 [Naja naja]|nr:hypothetical protein E2320_021278 [Naja naja]